MGDMTQSGDLTHDSRPVTHSHRPPTRDRNSLPNNALRAINQSCRLRHAVCINEGVVGSLWVRLGGNTQRHSGLRARFITALEESTMKWTKPEAEVVAVTMEVTAYVATL